MVAESTNRVEQPAADRFESRLKYERGKRRWVPAFAGTTESIANSHMGDRENPQ